jgi:hypothetical protein
MAARNDCYTAEERDEIIAHVLVNVASGRFVSRIFREDETTASGIKLPAHTTFWRWVLEDTTGELEQKVADARAKGIEALLDECGEIADDGRNDFVERENKDGSTYVALDKEAVMRSKLRVETRIKMAQMLKPKTYGPKLDLTSGGEKIGLSAELEAARKRVSE